MIRRRTKYYWTKYARFPIQLNAFHIYSIRFIVSDEVSSEGLFSIAVFVNLMDDYAAVSPPPPQHLAQRTFQ